MLNLSMISLTHYDTPSAKVSVGKSKTGVKLYCQTKTNSNLLAVVRKMKKTR